MIFREQDLMGKQQVFYLRYEFNFWNVHGIMDSLGLLQINDFRNRQKFEFSAYIYILL